MIDVVYPLGKGSTWNNNELRYSLRSIEKHLKGFCQVWIIGEKPAWITTVNHIPATDSKKVAPDTNILHKVMTACSTPEVSNTFLFMNDDHFLLRDVEASEYPYYFSGTISEYIRKRGNDGYGKRCGNTMDSLNSRNLPGKYFDIHYPILYTKSLFVKHVVNAYDHGKKDGMILKSLYANGIKAEGVQIEDCKLPHLLLKDLPCYSTYPTISSKAQQFLREMFPNKSVYEN